MVADRVGAGAMIYSAYREEGWKKRMNWHRRTRGELSIWRHQRRR